MRTHTLLAVAIVLAASMSARAQTTVPQQLAYQGLLTDLAGAAASGSHSIQFAIWPASTGGSTALWSDTLSVNVVNGAYSALLGTTAGDPFPTGLFDGTVRYLELTVDGDLLSPRQALTSVPYAMVSGAVQGGPVNGTSLAVNGIQTVNAAGHAMITAGGSSTTVSGAYCGEAAATAGRIEEPDSGLVGYRATKLLCQSVCGSPTAHMCGSSEMVRSVELGVLLPADNLWNSVGALATFDGPDRLNDCEGWTSKDPDTLASAFAGSTPDGGDRLTTDINLLFCDIAHPIACCD